MKETTFVINYDDYFIEFIDEDKKKEICNIDIITSDFVYRGYTFNMESDIEKSLEFEFKERFVDLTTRE